MERLCTTDGTLICRVTTYRNHACGCEQMVYSAGMLESSFDARADSCRHVQVQKIGEDWDMDGRLLKLVRCARWGLLMRTYLSHV